MNKDKIDHKPDLNASASYSGFMVTILIETLNNMAIIEDMNLKIIIQECNR
jgi:hypothetical protein